MFAEKYEVLILLFVVIGIFAWAFYKKLVLGEVAQPIWQSPEYLRFNQPVVQ